MNLDEKIEKVENTIKNRKIAIAFSGGADSTLLAYLASKVSDKPIAITIISFLLVLLNIAKKQPKNLE